MGNDFEQYLLMRTYGVSECSRPESSRMPCDFKYFVTKFSKGEYDNFIIVFCLWSPVIASVVSQYKVYATFQQIV